MPKNRSYNSVGAGMTPRLGNAKPDGLGRPGDRSRLAMSGGPEVGMPARPGARAGRPAKPAKRSGSMPRVARPGSGANHRKPQAKPVPVRSRVR